MSLGRKMTLHRYRTNCPGSLATAKKKLRENVKDWNARKTLDAVLDAPKSLQENGKTWRYWYTNQVPDIHGRCLFDGLLLCIPPGFVDGTSIKPGDDPSLNVNGDLDVFARGLSVLESIKEVEQNWSTNVMIIYIDSPEKPIDDRRILQEMSYVEKQLNPRISDPTDDVIYALSLSTVV